MDVVIKDVDGQEREINMQFYIDQVNDLPIINMINSIAYDSLNQYYYLAEDTTDISFQLLVNDIDSDITLNQHILYDLSELKWGGIMNINEYQNIYIDEEKIFYTLEDTMFNITIDSLLTNFNGLTSILFNLLDEENTSLPFVFYLFVMP